MSDQALKMAKLSWRDHQPYADQFDDIYFSTENGLLESEYVFLQGNKLAQRWQQSEFSHFTIVETGFGTGLNFLCAVNLWLNSAPKDATLHFISVEKFPLQLSDIEKTCAIWPQLGPITQDFLTLYQHILTSPSKENSSFLSNLNIKLTLYISDINDCLNLINYKVDAWFLDGFAPAKNPEMWQENLFQTMAKQAHTTSTFATFTASSMVRRGLIQAGFQITKQVGFGKKREMLTGIYAPNSGTQ